jgi:hypothetical protein
MPYRVGIIKHLKLFIMKNVLFIDTDNNQYWNERDFVYACRLNNIKPRHIYTYEIPEFNFHDVDCIVYGYKLYRQKEYLSMLPAHIARLVWTTTPEYFKDAEDPVLDRFASEENISTLPEHLHVIKPRVITLVNKIISLTSLSNEAQ